MTTDTMQNLIIPATLETLYMVFFSSLFAIIFGLILGIILYVTYKDGLKPMPYLYNVLSFIVNFGRSIPFIILVIYIFPFTKAIVGTTIGSTAAIVPLTVGSIPFVARVIENALFELDYGVVEAAKSFGASNLEIIFKVVLPETAPSIVNGLTLTIISIIGFSAMAGSIGAGGLGDVAIRFGFVKFDTAVLNVTVLIIVLLVQIVQISGNLLAKKLDKR